MFRLELIEGGGLPTAKFLDIKVLPKPDTIPSFGTSEIGTRIRRLRFLNKKPSAVEEIWLDADSGTIDPEKVSESLYRYYQLNLGFWISHATDMVSVGEVPDWAPVEFGQKSKSITGFIERLSWAQSDEAVEYSRTWFDQKIAHYVQRLK